MSTATFLPWALSFLLSSPVAGGQPPPATGGREPAPDSWAVVHAGSVWVCWTAGDDCWTRVELEPPERGPGPVADLEAEELGPAPLRVEDPLAPERLRLGFSGPRRLWIVVDEQPWVLERGHRRARAVDARPPVATARPKVPSCSPRRAIPELRGGKLGWREAPPCPRSRAAPASCLAPRGPELRRPTGLKLGAGVELSQLRRWSTSRVQASGAEPATPRWRRAAGLELLFVIELGFDPRRLQADRRGRQSARASRARRRALPAVEPGPLAAAETRAYAAIVCGEARR